MSFTPEYFNTLAKARRSVFPDQLDTTRKVPDEIIHQIIENATWAPNHGQAEPWQFTVFTGNGLKKLASFQSELYKEDAGTEFNEGKYIKLQNQPLKASHIISIGMKRTVTKRIPEIEDIEAVACAVQNIYLSVTAYGLGGYWTTGGITYIDKAKKFFGLGEQDKLLGFFYIGYIATPSPAAKRAPVQEKVNWVN
ncbi:MAG: nitroreductase [Bacteroidetes bacterium]|nr:nitroreductase [Bacteroidota bacterium]